MVLVGGAAVAPQATRIGVLMGYAETDALAQTYLSEFTQGLSELGWAEGQKSPDACSLGSRQPRADAGIRERAGFSGA